MSAVDPREVGSAKELLDLLRLDSIEYYEVRGRRRSAPDSELETEPQLEILQRHADRDFEVRCRCSVEAPDASYFTDAAARFVSNEPLTMPDEVAREFVERVGLMAVYPFIRESILTTSTRLGAGRVVLGLLRPGRVQIELDADAKWDAEEATSGES